MFLEPFGNLPLLGLGQAFDGLLDFECGRHDVTLPTDRPFVHVAGSQAKKPRGEYRCRGCRRELASRKTLVRLRPVLAFMTSDPIREKQDGDIWVCPRPEGSRVKRLEGRRSGGILRPICAWALR